VRVVRRNGLRWRRILRAINHATSRTEDKFPRWCDMCSSMAFPLRRKGRSTVELRPSLRCFIFALESVSEPEISLEKVIRSPVDDVIPYFAEDSDMGGKAIFESATKVAQHPIRSKVVADRVCPFPGESHLPAYTR